MRELQGLQEEQELHLRSAKEESVRLAPHKDQFQKQLEDGMAVAAAAAAQENASQEHAEQVARMQRKLEDMKMNNEKELYALLAQVQKMKQDRDAAEATNCETWLFLGVWQGPL